MHAVELSSTTMLSLRTSPAPPPLASFLTTPSLSPIGNVEMHEIFLRLKKKKT